MTALHPRMLDLLSSAALTLGLLAVGAGLRFESGALRWPALAWWTGVKLVALPAVALALSRAMGLSPLEQQIAVVMAAVPTATSAYILAVQMKAPGPPVAMLISRRNADRGADAAAVDRDRNLAAIAREKFRDDPALRAFDAVVERAIVRVVLLRAPIRGE